MTGIDCAWRSRVTSFYQGAEAAAIIARASCDGRATALAMIAERGEQVERQAGARPFRFEDLDGRPEPEKWGPCYPKTASQAVEKWRMTARGRELSADEKRQYGQAVGEWIRGLNSVKAAARVSLKYRMPDYAAKCRAEFAAKAASEKLAWALGKAKNCQGRTIVEEYEAAMAAKRERLADPEAYAAKLAAAAKAERDRLEAVARANAKAAKAYRPRKAAKLKRAA